MRLRWAFFKGISIFSKAIKFWTRSEYSHVGFMLNDDILIECWGTNPFNIIWRFESPPFAKHSKGTPVEIWSIEFPDEEALEIREFMKNLAYSKAKYDWIGVISFVLKIDKHNRKGFFCSEGCVYPICKIKRFNTIKPHHVNPVMFLNIIEAMGGYLETQFVL